MSRSVLILLILLLLWIIFGAFVCKKFICNPNGSETTAVPCGGDWEIQDGTFKVESDSYISFTKSKSTHSKVGTELDKALSSTADYLKSNARKTLTVIGYFDDSENYSGGTLTDLGLARANDVKNMLVSKGAPASQISVVTERWVSDCFSGNTLNRGADFRFN